MFRSFIFALTCSSFLFAADVATAKLSSSFLSRSVKIGRNEYPYAVYLPSTFKPSRRYPVILFLHGSGERGNDGLLQTQVGLGAAIRNNPDRFHQTIVVFPQAPKDTSWLDEPAQAAMVALDHTIAEFHADTNRIYLTGISMGGYGAWYLVTQFTKRFTAVVPICGGILPSPATRAVKQLPITIGTSNPYATAAAAVPHIPIWIFHGSTDDVIPVSESRRMFEELKRLGANVRFTEYPGVDHNSWDRAYGESELWNWLFEH